MASVVWNAGNGRVYASTNSGHLLELDSDLNLLRSRNLAGAGLIVGRAHQLTSDGTYLYIHGSGDGHRVYRVSPETLDILAFSPTLSGTYSPEGFLFLNGSLYVAVGGPPGKIVRLDPTSLAVSGEWPLPDGVENHGLTTDGTNLFVLAVPKRNVLADKYYKVSPSLQQLATVKFGWIGSLGGNIYMPKWGAVFTGPSRLARIDPAKLLVKASSTTSGPYFHWLATDGDWVYAIDYDGYIRVFDPGTLKQAYKQATGGPMLHYAIVQNGYLWTASETTPGVLGRYGLYVNQPPTVTLGGVSDGVSYPAPATFTLTANASDAEGTITKVEFYSGTTRLATDASAPYSFTWRDVPPGNYALTARAYDSYGATATTPDVHVVVSGSGGTVDFSAAADSYIFETSPTTNFGTAVQLSVSGPPARREFYIRFDVAGLPSGAQITDARLILVCQGTSAQPGGGGTIRRFDPGNPTWAETTPTWAAPLAGSDASGDLATLGPVTAGTTYAFQNLATAISGNGPVTFVVRSAMDDGGHYHSRQATTASLRPILRITYTVP